MPDHISIGAVMCGFFSITGETTEEKWIQLCRTSCLTIESYLREDVDIESNKQALNTAATYHAFYMYVLRQCATGIAEFKTVDMSLVNANALTISSAKALLDDSMAAIAHLIRPAYFSFKSF